MKYIKEFSSTEKLTSKDYTIFKIRYYADGINVRKGKFEGDDKQHWDRAKEYGDFFWRFFEKTTGESHKEWVYKYFLSSRECAIEELHDIYDIIIPESEEYYYWYIPNKLADIIDWVKENCKLPFTIVKRAPSQWVFNVEKTTWKRESAAKRTAEINKKHFNGNKI